MSGSGFSGQQPSGTPRRLADREDDHPGAARCAGRSHEHDKGKGHEDLLVLLSIVIRGRAIRTGCSVNLVSEP
jgi:hypothetical protein